MPKRPVLEFEWLDERDINSVLDAAEIVAAGRVLTSVVGAQAAGKTSFCRGMQRAFAQMESPILLGALAEVTDRAVRTGEDAPIEAQADIFTVTVTPGAFDSMVENGEIIYPYRRGDKRGGVLVSNLKQVTKFPPRPCLTTLPLPVIRRFRVELHAEIPIICIWPDQASHDAFLAMRHLDAVPDSRGGIVGAVHLNPSDIYTPGMILIENEEFPGLRDLEEDERLPRLAQRIADRLLMAPSVIELARCVGWEPTSRLELIRRAVLRCGFSLNEVEEGDIQSWLWGILKE